MRANRLLWLIGLLLFLTATLGPLGAQDIDEPVTTGPNLQTGGEPGGQAVTTGSATQGGSSADAVGLALGPESLFLPGSILPSLRNLIRLLTELIQELFPGWQPPTVVANPTPAPAPGGTPPAPRPPSPPPGGRPPAATPPGGQAPDTPTPGTQPPATTPGTTPAPPGATSAFTGFPARPADAETGSAFLTRTAALSPAQREAAVLEQILAGNVPDFLRQMCEVTVTMRLRDGRDHRVTYRVLPDYLAIGSNGDFVRMPMNPITAQRLADRFGCMLPTSKMVDDIYAQAQTKLNPQPMSGGQYPNWQSRMMKNEFYGEHQRLVESQRSGTGHQLGQLVAGHKKDVCISNFLNTHPRQVIIYGWHDKRNGNRPIQGTSWIHENTYADYSHGVRLISKAMIVDGQPMSADQLFADGSLSSLVSREGPLRDLRAVR